MISKTIGFRGTLFSDTPMTWVCLKMVSTPKPNGFHDHYPYEKWLQLGIYPIFRQTHVAKYVTKGANHVCQDGVMIRWGSHNVPSGSD